MKKLAVLLGVLTLLNISGCHMMKFKSNDDRYLYAKKVPELSVPEEVSREKLANDYPISGDQYPENHHPVSQMPPGSLAGIRG